MESSDHLLGLGGRSPDPGNGALGIVPLGGGDDELARVARASGLLGGSLGGRSAGTSLLDHNAVTEPTRALERDQAKIPSLSTSALGASWEGNGKLRLVTDLGRGEAVLGNRGGLEALAGAGGVNLGSEHHRAVLVRVKGGRGGGESGTGHRNRGRRVNRRERGVSARLGRRRALSVGADGRALDTQCRGNHGVSQSLGSESRDDEEGLGEEHDDRVKVDVKDWS